MKVFMAYKYKLFVSKKQKELLFNHIFSHNQTWNILLNESNKQFEANKLRVEQSLEPIFLSSVEQDNLVKRVLRDRNLKFNTKVVQQTRVNFNKTFKQTIKNIKNKSGDGMLKFKQSRNFNNQSFETTKEQYSILDSTQSEQALLVRKNSKPNEDYIGIEKENEDPNKTELFYLLSTLDNKINVLNTNDDFVLISIGFDYKGDLLINYYESKLQILAYIMFLLTLGFLIILIGIELYKFRNKVFE